MWSLDMLTKRSRAAAFLTYGLLSISLIASCFPILWMVMVSFKTPVETFRYPMTWIVENPTLENYARVWSYANFARYFLNSVIVSLSTTVLSVAVAAPAAYGFSRFRYLGGNALRISFLVSQMFPPILFIIPYFVMMRAVDLVNSYPALFLAYVSFALPFCTWMLIGYFSSIPRDLDEAALVDGCDSFRTFIYVIMPLATPGVAATALFGFLVAWKEFLFALCLTTQESMYVITVAISQLIGETRVGWNEIMAAGVIATIPTLLMYAFLESYLVEGLTAGAVKG
jgi:multiple sugar transport system permease protein